MTRTITLFRNGLLLAALAALPFSSTYAQFGGECGADAGSTLMYYGPDCLVNGQAIISGTPNGDAIVPEGFTIAFLLSRTNGLILEQVGPTPYFQVTTADVWRIHTLVFDPVTFDPSSIAFGTMTGYDLAAQFTQHGGPICAAISFTVYGSKTEECDDPCEAFASPVSIDSTTVCLTDGQATLSAQLDGQHVVPAGFEVRYVLSRTNGLIIEQFSETPSFTVNSVDVWRIHSFVYDPNTFDLGSVILGQTSIYDLYPQLIQGGGSICASLVISGAFVKTGECKAACEADAGGLMAEQPDLCLTDGMAVATALPDGLAVIPDGSEMAYLLVQDNVIIQVSDSPVFTLGALGQFEVHALVFDPATFDMALLVMGESTLADVAAHFTPEGGGLCGDLDMTGALFQVADCTASCEADAGAMVGSGQTVCLENGIAGLTATSYGDTLIPPGYTMGYLLSEGGSLVLLEWNDEAAFSVDHVGEYRIHALVHDNLTLDLDAIPWGTATVLDLHALLIQGGGTICAGLDVLGASFIVEECLPPCDGGSDNTVTVCYTDPPFQMLDQLGGEPCPGGTWTNPANPEISGTFNPSSDAAGIYTYTVIGTDGTIHTAALTINVLECPGGDLTMGTEEASPEALVLWPNPAEGVLHIALPGAVAWAVQVELFDATGRRVHVGQVERQGGHVVLDVSSLPHGSWAVRVLNGGNTHVARFIR